MRESYFRGKRIDNGEWVVGHYCTNPEWDRNTYGEHHWIISCQNAIRYEVDPETVGQYTGLPDVAEKEIFEGDIMATAVSGITQHTGVVEYKDGAFGLMCTDGAAFFLCFVAGSYTVIGNIHDNPELMEDEK